MKFTYKTGARPLEGYKINRGVGAGGFGEVYFAISDAGKEVALKRVQRNLDVEVRGVRQCLNLKHPNLIALFDLKYDDQGQAWVVMEYIAGESLRDVLDRNPNGLPQADAERWFRQIAAGVAYLHDHGIVHRDLKPGNIFDDEGVVKIGDYGLSKYIAASRRSGHTESVGTFHYMAPEIGKGVYGKEIDVYAMGIVLYEMLTGRVPFDGETSQEIIMKHLTDNPDVSGIAEPYRSVIQRALHKDPEKRYRTIGDMLEGLSGRVAAELPRARASKPEPIYIGDDEPPEMMFGQVRHHAVLAEAVPPLRPEAAPASRRFVAAAAASRQPAARPAPAAATARRSGGASSKKLWLRAGLVLLALLLVVQFPALLGVAALGGVAYAGYAVCQAIGRRRAARVQAVPARVVADPNNPLWRAEIRQEIRRRLFSERAAELAGSLLVSALVAAVLILAALLLQGETLDGSVAGWSVYTWLTVSSIAGCWILLSLGKFWETREGDPKLRRLVMLAAGLMIGAFAFGAAQVLLVDLPDLDRWTAHAFSQNQLVGRLYTADGTPLVTAYLLYFAGIFAILRWWGQTDPLRSARLSLSATAACLLWAWIMHMFCQFPQPWGLILAGTISVAVQLSAPWVNPKHVPRVRAAHG